MKQRKSWSLASAWDYASQFDTKNNWSRCLILCQRALNHFIWATPSKERTEKLELLFSYRENAFARLSLSQEKQS